MKGHDDAAREPALYGVAAVGDESGVIVVGANCLLCVHVATHSHIMAISFRRPYNSFTTSN